MRIIQIGSNYYFIAPALLNKDELERNFLVAANVKVGTFSEKCLLKIFRSIFSHMINLNYIYTMFYQNEYGSFREYLYYKELLEKEEIELLIKDTNENETVYKLDLSFISYNISTLFDYEDKLLKKLNKLFERC